MSGKLAYLDTSAFVKLSVAEPESDALKRYLAGWPERAASSLLRTESIRALRRVGLLGEVGAARRLFGDIRLVRCDDEILDRAADLEPADLRALDAIHIASALALGSDLGVLITYDSRLAAAAAHHGIAVSSPA